MTSSSAARAKTLGFRSLVVLGGAAVAVSALALPSKAAETAAPGFTSQQVRLLDTRTSATVTGPVHGLVQVALPLIPAASPTASPTPLPTGDTVELTITTVDSTGGGYVVAYPDGSTPNGALPGTSNINYAAGRTLATTVLLPVSEDGMVDLYVAGTSTQVVVDEQGYFDSSVLTGGAPTRIADSRTAVGFAKSGPQVGAVTLTIPTDSFTANEPVALNLTALPSNGGSGYITAYTGGATKPTTSSVNFAGGLPASNLVLVTPSSTGTVTLFASGQTNILVDLEASAPAGSTLKSTGARIADSRTPTGLPKGPLSGTYTLTIPAADAPAGTTGVVLNLTSTGQTGGGIITAFTGSTPPTTSELQFSKGFTVAQTVVVPVTVGTSATTVTIQIRGTSQLVVDTEGYVTTVAG